MENEKRATFKSLSYKYTIIARNIIQISVWNRKFSLAFSSKIAQ